MDGLKFKISLALLDGLHSCSLTYNCVLFGWGIYKSQTNLNLWQLSGNIISSGTARPKVKFFVKRWGTADSSKEAYLTGKAFWQYVTTVVKEGGGEYNLYNPSSCFKTLATHQQVKNNAMTYVENMLVPSRYCDKNGIPADASWRGAPADEW